MVFQDDMLLLSGPHALVWLELYAPAVNSSRSLSPGTSNILVNALFVIPFLNLVCIPDPSCYRTLSCKSAAYPDFPNATFNHDIIKLSRDGFNEESENISVP